MNLFLRVLLGLCPVFGFLAALLAIDSYKLLRLRAVLMAIAVGAVAAAICFLINGQLAGFLDIDSRSFARYVAPVVEELVKALYLFGLIRYRRVGFMVDAAIFGFAIGAGFAFLENIYYLKSVSEGAAPLTWVVRGFGTAAMHGGATAMCGIITRVCADRWENRILPTIAPGLVVAIAFHSLFNHFLLPPVLSAAAMMIVLPLVLGLVFSRSEKATEEWLGAGMDNEVELLELLASEQMADSHLAQYLQSLRRSFPDEVVVDMLCYIQLHAELALQAKGAMIIRQSGMEYPADPELLASFEELRHLERQIGVTGKFAIKPFLGAGSKDLWQFQMLMEEGKRGARR